MTELTRLAIGHGTWAPIATMLALTAGAAHGARVDAATPWNTELQLHPPATTPAGAAEAPLLPADAFRLSLGMVGPEPQQRRRASSDMGQGDFTVGDWHVWVAPYLWLPAIDGDSTVAGVTAAIDMNFADIWDNFDVIGVTGRVEAWNANRFGFILDGMWVDMDTEMSVFKENSTLIELERTLSGPGGLMEVDLSIELNPSIAVDSTVNVEVEQSQVDFAVGWRLIDRPLRPSRGADSPWLILDAIGGARYQYLRQDITLSGTVTTGMGATESFRVTLGDSKDWIEPLVGARAAFLLNDKWSVAVRGDVSGFGIGSASDLTWNAMAGVHHHFSSRFTVMVGYRVQGFDYESGGAEDRFGGDWIMHGPFIAGGFTF